MDQETSAETIVSEPVTDEETNGGPKLPYNEGDFNENFWLRFSPKRAADIIQDPRPSFRGYKDALLAALLAWTLRPHDAKFRQMVTTAAVMQEVMRAERWAEKRATKTRDFDARYVRLGQEFISELYYGVGGLKAAYNNESARRIRQKIVATKRGPSNTVEVMRIYRFVYERRPNLLKGSLQRANTVIRRIWDYHTSCYMARNFVPYEESQLKVSWGQLEVSAPYLYAAAHTEISDERTLLQDLLSGRMVPNSKAAWVTPWLSRTAYALTFLSDNYDQNSFITAQWQVPSCPPERFTDSALSLIEMNVISDVFSIS
ncbi:hypothetical protein [Neorhizobium galegae]|uniref:Uncharacterized protein n=1 Tax=Neorhizobium galegae bv. officinalis TaxID=323656 RepID=A0A0T7GAZ6_NEOGA|nr:hypothetical protein [Neorhizobium galegae]CDZ44277.1 Hypothetical protein NGAL_HAMBI1189_02720 [Neorhizobium galegae bv. officinalis]